jgi:hypothetical protein
VGRHQTVKDVVGQGVFVEDVSEMVLVKDIEFYSLCEHHLLPFYGRVHVAYIPDGHIIGLSKIPRIVDVFARRLQVQERMTVQIAEAIQDVLHPKGVEWWPTPSTVHDDAQRAKAELVGPDFLSARHLPATQDAQRVLGFRPGLASSDAARTKSAGSWPKRDRRRTAGPPSSARRRDFEIVDRSLRRRVVGLPHDARDVLRLVHLRTIPTCPGRRRRAWYRWHPGRPWTRESSRREVQSQRVAESPEAVLAGTVRDVARERLRAAIDATLKMRAPALASASSASASRSTGRRVDLRVALPVGGLELREGPHVEHARC